MEFPAGRDKNRESESKGRRHEELQTVCRITTGTTAGGLLITSRFLWARIDSVIKRCPRFVKLALFT